MSSHSACKLPSAAKWSSTDKIQSLPQAVAPSDTITTKSPSDSLMLLFSNSTAVRIPTGREVDSTIPARFPLRTKVGAAPAL